VDAGTDCRAQFNQDERTLRASRKWCCA